VSSAPSTIESRCFRPPSSNSSNSSNPSPVERSLARVLCAIYD
jgi:hypothetical protein